MAKLKSKYKVKHRLTGREWGYLYSYQDAENTVFHLEDTYGFNSDHLEIIEIKEV